MLLNRETCFASQFTCNLIRFLFSQLQIPTVTYCKLAQLQSRHFQIDDDEKEERRQGVVEDDFYDDDERMSQIVSSIRGNSKFQNFTPFKTILAVSQFEIYLK